MLTTEQRATWSELGWLVMPGLLTENELVDIETWVDDVARWSVVGGPGLHHHEQTASGAVLARSERFADDHVRLGTFIRTGVIADVLGELFGDDVVLFKEKINYKFPGGGGFAPHQDATAYRFVDHHISVMAPIDAATVASGCLYFAPGHSGGSMPTDERGRVEASYAERLDWRPVEVEPGDLVFFDSYAPHYSDTNTTNSPRRALYLTYNAATLGDHRERYYADKEAEFDREGDTFGDKRVRISISDDFLGVPVADPLRPSS